jgi:hypothetical protein
MITLRCVGGPYHGRHVQVASSETQLTPAMIARGRIRPLTGEHEDLPLPTFGHGYYAPQNRTRNGRIERVLRWEGEL